MREHVTRLSYFRGNQERDTKAGAGCYSYVTRLSQASQRLTCDAPHMRFGVGVRLLPFTLS